MFEHVWTSLIKFDQVWSRLIMFDPIWSMFQQYVSNLHVKTQNSSKCSKYSKMVDDDDYDYEKLFLRPLVAVARGQKVCSQMLWARQKKNRFVRSFTKKKSESFDKNWGNGGHF